MGSWGITMRENDYGLDLLGTIVGTELKAVDFSAFNVIDALEVVKADVMEEIRRANHGCSAAHLIFYFSENFPHNIKQRTLLIGSDKKIAQKSLQALVETKSASNGGLSKGNPEMFHAHILFVAPLGAGHMTQPGTGQH